jgi:hypothetical protein
MKQKQEELRDKRFGSRSKKTFTLDFAGRKVNDEQESLSYQKYAEEIEQILDDKKNQEHFSGSIANREDNLFKPTVKKEIFLHYLCVGSNLKNDFFSSMYKTSLAYRFQTQSKKKLTIF